MTSIQLPLFSDNTDKRPLPLIVADRWGFTLTYIEQEEGYIYSAKEWVIGLGGDKTTWSKLKKELLLSMQQLPYQAPNGKTYQMDFVDDDSLYGIAQEMRGMEKRPQLQEIKNYLRDAGVKMDKYRRNPEAAVNDAMGQYHIEGKSDSWVEARIQSVITRKQFTDALKDVVINAPANLYSAGTEQIYAGLWQMTTAQLRGELGLKPKQNVRDAFGEYALIYTRLAEMVSTEQLRNAEIVPMSVAMEIVYKVAGMIRNQAQETARLLGIDLITGRKLLKD